MGRQCGVRLGGVGLGPFLATLLPGCAQAVFQHHLVPVWAAAYTCSQRPVASNKSRLVPSCSSFHTVDLTWPGKVALSGQPQFALMRLRFCVQQWTAGPCVIFGRYTETLPSVAVVNPKMCGGCHVSHAHHLPASSPVWEKAHGSNLGI